jgi:hypothetical protein
MTGISKVTGLTVFFDCLAITKFRVLDSLEWFSLDFTRDLVLRAGPKETTAFDLGSLSLGSLFPSSLGSLDKTFASFSDTLGTSFVSLFLPYFESFVVLALFLSLLGSLFSCALTTCPRF